MRLRKALPVLLVLAALQVALFLGYRSVREHRESRSDALRAEPVVGIGRPKVDLIDQHGLQRPLPLVAGLPTLVHFWATWCPPCRTEMPGLMKLGRELEQSGDARLILVAMDRDWNDIRRFFDGSLPEQLWRDEGDLARGLGVRELPSSFFLDRDGVPTLRVQGARDWSEDSVTDSVRGEIDRLGER